MTAPVAPLETEVLVVGAGASGLCAALAAARHGARTLLVESAGFPGGNSAVLPWLGFHDRDYRLVCKGLAGEFVTALQALGAAVPPQLDPKCGSAFSFDPHVWKCLIMDLLRAAGVRVLFHTQVLETLRDGDRIAGVRVADRSGQRLIRARVTLDCSGDGEVAARGGVRWEKGRTGDGLVQAPTLVFRLGGVDRAAFVAGCQDRANGYREWLLPYPDLWEKMMRRLPTLPVIICGGFAPLVARAREAGELQVPQTRVVGVKLHRPDQFLVVMTRVLGLDPTDADSLSDAYARVYQQIPELLRFFQRWVPGFKGTWLQEIAPMLGVRESRRIMGDYVLTGDDLVAGRVFPDSICMGAYHIDIHRPSGTWVESRNVRAYTIPLRSLIAGGVDDLLMAGKCLSATHEAVASTRVIPICMAQGQAIGTVAALAVARGCAVRQVPVSLVQDRLRAQGAELGDTVGPADQAAIDAIGQLPLDEDGTSGEGDAASRQAAAWLGPKP